MTEKRNRLARKEKRKQMKSVRLSKQVEDDIEFVRKEFGIGSVSYRVIQSLLREMTKLEQENERLNKKIKGKETHALRIEKVVEKLKEEAKRKQLKCSCGGNLINKNKRNMINSVVEVDYLECDECGDELYSADVQIVISTIADENRNI